MTREVLTVFKVWVEMGFTILHPRITLEIILEEVDTLLFHEQTLESLQRELVTELASDQCLKHPIIVDRQNRVVLDGTHRLAATRELGCRFIPVCLVDYNNPNVVIDCWHRVVSPQSDIERVTRTIEDMGFHLEEMCITEARNLVEKREATASIAYNSTCFVIRGNHADIKDIYDAIREIEHTLRAADYSISYETETDAFYHLTSRDGCFLLMVPTVSKNEVVNIALSGQVFSYKTTRHVIPLRPLFVNASFEWLHSPLSPEDLNARFARHLSTKQFERLPPNRILDRRYDEELHVFK
jgi:hypothetical protein